MNDLQNLDTLDDIQRGKQPAGEVTPFAWLVGMSAAELAALPESATPSDTETRARCLIALLDIEGLTTVDRMPYPTGGAGLKVLPAGPAARGPTIDPRLLSPTVAVSPTTKKLP